jgi:GcrA cell cycle regulator
MPAQWTDERCDWLRALSARGLSCSQIAAEMGEGLTRNGVIGKQHRMGISNIQMLTPEQQAARRADVAERRSQRQAARVLHFKLRPTKRAPLPEGDMGEKIEMQPCTFWELTSETCRWPIAETLDSRWNYCGATSVDGLPYCRGHCRMAYRPVAGSRAWQARDAAA